MSEEQLPLYAVCICPPWATGLTYSPDTPPPQGGRTIWTMTYPRRYLEDETFAAMLAGGGEIPGLPLCLGRVLSLHLL